MTTTLDTGAIADDRRPLHSPFGQKMFRIMTISVLTFWSVSAISHVVRMQSLRDLMVVVLMMMAIAIVARWTFRSRAIYGSPRGLEYREKRRWRTIPWEHVGLPTYTIMRATFFAYEARVQISGEERRAIWFHATNSELDEFRRMRAAALAGR